MEISELRKALKGTGIKITVKSMSYGRHAEVKIDGYSIHSAMTSEVHEKIRDRIVLLRKTIGSSTVTQDSDRIYGFTNL